MRANSQLAGGKQARVVVVCGGCGMWWTAECFDCLSREQDSAAASCGHAIIVSTCTVVRPPLLSTFTLAQRCLISPSAVTYVARQYRIELYNVASVVNKPRVVVVCGGCGMWWTAECFDCLSREQDSAAASCGHAIIVSTCTVVRPPPPLHIHTRTAVSDLPISCYLCSETVQDRIVQCCQRGKQAESGCGVRGVWYVVDRRVTRLQPVVVTPSSFPLVLSYDHLLSTFTLAQRCLISPSAVTYVARQYRIQLYNVASSGKQAESGCGVRGVWYVVDRRVF
ncbi:hypothetical protein J6590_100946 [Homalodisca vitripennis]|nr:hypothetical protein J6590_100946 [Homalodisca vitripennis]